MSKNKLVAPVVKWVGGKRQLLDEITPLLPKRITSYCEPFIGGGAVLFSIQPSKAIVNDLNSDLITVYETIRDDVETLIEALKKHENTAEYFYTIRDMDRLRLWKDIPEIGSAVSGIGRYCGSFTLPEDWTEQDGLIADLGTLHEMARVTVNGRLVQYADMMDPRIDISGFVKPGENEIRIEVSTTLLNRLIATGRYQEGSPAFMSEETIEYQDYGLTQCSLIPYGKRPV